MSNNLAIYNAVKEVPENAKKAIVGGPLKGKTDINPMWRLKTLTEQFGPCGIGWYYTIEKQWLEPSTDSKTTSAFCNILLYVKVGDNWSQGIPGTGGSSFTSVTNDGRTTTSDECFKMALTDALSVSAKALGVAADVYWDADKTKYTNATEQPAPAPVTNPTPAPKSAQQQVATDDSGLKTLAYIADLNKCKTYANLKVIMDKAKEDKSITPEQYEQLRSVANQLRGKINGNTSK